MTDSLTLTDVQIVHLLYVCTDGTDVGETVEAQAYDRAVRAVLALRAERDALRDQVASLSADVERLQILGPDAEVRITVEARALASAMMQPALQAWREDNERLRLKLDQLKRDEPNDAAELRLLRARVATLEAERHELARRAAHRSAYAALIGYARLQDASATRGAEIIAADVIEELTGEVTDAC